MKKLPLRFVNAHPSEGRRAEEARLARSHTARTNRERRHTKAHFVKARGTRAIVPSRARAGGHRAGAKAEHRDIKGEDTDICVTTNVEPPFVSPGRSTASSHAPGKPWNHDPTPESGLAIPRTLSPVLGAPTTNSPALNSFTARAADWCLNVIWPNLLIDRGASQAWFELFKGSPLIFHAFQFAVATHHDLLCHQFSWSRSQRAIAHKHQTFRLLNKTLSDLSNTNLELAILAVLVLAANELRPEQVLPDRISSFDPHLPGANWLSVYSRMDQVVAHGHAMILLIQRRGGLHSIQMPGLAGVLAFSDLMYSSAALTRPSSPYFWDCELAEIPWRAKRESIVGNGVAGHGFEEKIPNWLPETAKTILIKVSRVNVAMEQCRKSQLHEKDLKMIVDVRNQVQHELLSLPSWDDLDFVTRDGSNRAAHECSRLTALMFSTAVIFPLPPLGDWHTMLVREIASLLTTEVVDSWNENAPSLLLWILVVSCHTKLKVPKY